MIAEDKYTAKAVMMLREGLEIVEATGERWFAAELYRAPRQAPSVPSV